MTNPKIRFKDKDGKSFPDWEEKKLGELGSFTKGASLSKSDISDEGNPFILYGELYTTYNEVAYNIKRKTQAVVNKKYYSIVGDVVIPTSGESPEEISTATCIMVPNVILAGDLNIYRSEKVDGRVISYIINHQAKDKIARIAQGKSIVHIQAKQLEKIEVSYPADEREQQKIADFLSNVDEVIAASEEEVANLEQQKKAVIQKIFSQEVRFKKEDGSDFPDWEETPLSYCMEIRDEKQVPTKDAPLMAFVAYEGVSEKGDRYDRSFLIKTDDKKYKRTEYNDFIYSSNNLDVGSIGLNKYGTAVISVVYEIFKIKKDFNPDCLSALIQMPHNIAKILRYRQGCLYGQYKIHAENFLAIRIPLPSIPEQQLIADFLTSYDEAIAAAKQELAKWKELKKGLLQQMFV